jgi:hypothetical protein
MAIQVDRRSFIKSAVAAGAAVGIGPAPGAALFAAEESMPLF